MHSSPQVYDFQPQRLPHNRQPGHGIKKFGVKAGVSARRAFWSTEDERTIIALGLIPPHGISERRRALTARFGEERPLPITILIGHFDPVWR